MKGTGFFWRINQFRILELCVNCQHLVWTALSWSRLGWVVGVKCWRCWPKVPARCIVFITRPMSRTSSFLPPPVTMSQAVDRNSKNWLDFKETFTARVGTINEYILAPVVETNEHLCWRIAATHLGQTSKLWNVQFVILSKQCENLQTKAPPLSDASTVQSAGGRRRWWMVEPWVGEGPFSDVG